MGARELIGPVLDLQQLRMLMQKLTLRSGKELIYPNNSQYLSETSLASFRRMAREHLVAATEPDVLPARYNPQPVNNTFDLGIKTFQQIMLLEHKVGTASRFKWGYNHNKNTQVSNPGPDGRISPEWDAYQESDMGTDNTDDEIM